MAVLCLMRLIPHRDGIGGSQRAWHLLKGLKQFGPVHFVLVRPQTQAMSDAALRDLQRLDGIAETVTSIPVPEWMPMIQRPRWGEKLDVLLRLRSWEVPSMSSRTLRRIASLLPDRKPDLIFAGRLSSALLAEALISRGLLSCRTRLADFDDVQSDIRQRALASRPAHEQPFLRLDHFLIKKGEGTIIKLWDSISLASCEDVEVLKARYGAGNLFRVPNVIDRPFLPQRRSGEEPRILFVGGLRHEPNVHGLRIFLEQAWPAIKRIRPDMVLDVVGMAPDPQTARFVRDHGANLHSNVPSVEPYYEAADLAIAPIFLGSGTRIKLLEAMAFGRVTVATTFGAHGLGATDGTHIELADTMDAFAAKVLTLVADHGRRHRIAIAARQFVEREFGSHALQNALAQMIEHRQSRCLVPGVGDAGSG